MASGWNLWAWLECIGVVSGWCCKEVYRFFHNITYSYSTCIIRPKKHLKINKEVRMLLPKKDLIQVE